MRCRRPRCQGVCRGEGVRRDDLRQVQRFARRTTLDTHVFKQHTRVACFSKFSLSFFDFFHFVFPMRHSAVTSRDKVLPALTKDLAVDSMFDGLRSWVLSFRLFVFAVLLSIVDFDASHSA